MSDPIRATEEKPVLLADSTNTDQSLLSLQPFSLPLTWIKRKLGIDRAIGFTVLARGWSSLAGLVTVALIARFLSPAEQGYYYVFGSLIALQVVFELGFSFVILQMASHERAHLTISAAGLVSGDEIPHARLASVLRKAVRWYSSAAAVLAIFLLAAGSRFFYSHVQTSVSVSWQSPWYLTAIAATLTFQLDPILSFMEGCGFVANIARLRFAQAVMGSGVSWLVMFAHHGLFAPAMVISANAFCALVWLWGYRRLLIGLLRYKSGKFDVHWMKEVWPFQWRIAVSWLCGYFIFQLYNPVLFAFHGAVVAGQMGMSLSLVNALNSISISWINTKAAPFGTMIARGQFRDLDRLFFQAAKQAIGVCTVGAGIAWSILFYFHLRNLPFGHRVLDPLPLAILLLNTCLNTLIFAQAVYLRAHKQEKFLIPSIIGAILVATSTYIFGRSCGALGVVTGSLAACIFVGIPLSTLTFVKYRRIWHE